MKKQPSMILEVGDVFTWPHYRSGKIEHWKVVKDEGKDSAFFGRYRAIKSNKYGKTFKDTNGFSTEVVDNPNFTYVGRF